MTKGTPRFILGHNLAFSIPALWRSLRAQVWQRWWVVVEKMNRIWKCAEASPRKDAGSLVITGADSGFWSGGSNGVLTPGGPLTPSICSKLGFSLKIAWKLILEKKKSWAQGGPGPAGNLESASAFKVTCWSMRCKMQRQMSAEHEREWVKGVEKTWMLRSVWSKLEFLQLWPLWTLGSHFGQYFLTVCWNGRTFMSSACWDRSWGGGPHVNYIHPESEYPSPYPFLRQKLSTITGTFFSRIANHPSEITEKSHSMAHTAAPLCPLGSSAARKKSNKIETKLSRIWSNFFPITTQKAPNYYTRPVMSLWQQVKRKADIAGSIHLSCVFSDNLFSVLVFSTLKTKHRQRVLQISTGIHTECGRPQVPSDSALFSRSL